MSQEYKNTLLLTSRALVDRGVREYEYKYEYEYGTKLKSKLPRRYTALSVVMMYKTQSASLSHPCNPISIKKGEKYAKDS